MFTNAISLNEGEQVVTVIRRHWFSLAVEGALDIFIFFIMVSVVVIVDSVAVAEKVALPAGVIFPLGFFGIGFVGLILWTHFFTSWSDHWLDAWIITTERVIDIDQDGFFKREVSSFPLDRIQDVTYTVTGIIPTWLHFGDVRIQTASISEDFIMRQVPFPQDVKEQLLSTLKR